MGYTDSPKRKIITIIAWLAGAAIGGFAVYFFSEVPVDQPRVVAKKSVASESRTRRAKHNRSQQRKTVTTNDLKTAAKHMETATFALG